MTRAHRWCARLCHCVIPAKAGIAFDLAVVVGAVVPAFAVEVTRKINGKSDDLTFVG
ncbi:hypothetical protein [Stenotrophomonas sp.]|uniref:hypothetical protein n=1 Tax=Stenotrophomonas sp. TaxID=69392 RepID=UPI0028A74127|nr:hypothetical protein [Stenotrophomonas sp.]